VHPVDSIPTAAGEAVWNLDSDDGFEGLLGHPVVESFLGELRTLYAMLFAVVSFPDTPYFENERSDAALSLIGFLRQTHRSDIYTKYVHYLQGLHQQMGNSAEEALTYLLHAALPLQPIVEAFELSEEAMTTSTSGDLGADTNFKGHMPSSFPEPTSTVGVILDTEDDGAALESGSEGVDAGAGREYEVNTEGNAVDQDDLEPTSKPLDRALQAWTTLGIPPPTDLAVKRFSKLADPVSGLPAPWHWAEFPQLLLWPQSILPASVLNAVSSQTAQLRHPNIGRQDLAGFRVLFKEQLASERISFVLHNAIKMLEEAQCWELANGIAQTLRARYSRVEPNGSRLVSILSKEAELTNQIFTKLRV